MLLHVSLSTVRRRMTEFQLSVRASYSTMSDNQLDRMVTTILSQHPNCGYRMVQGFLAAQGHRIQQNRVRESLLRLDPEGVLARWRCTVHRRNYSVPTSNTLWHIDGNHRLIRYGVIFSLDVITFHTSRTKSTSGTGFMTLSVLKYHRLLNTCCIH